MFQQIKKLLKIEDVIEFYHEAPRHKKYICPFHDDRHPSLSIHSENQIFKCFVCETKGDLITFTAKLFGLSNIDACKKLNDDFRLNLNMDKNYKKVASEFMYKKKNKKENKMNTYLNL